MVIQIIDRFAIVSKLELDGTRKYLPPTFWLVPTRLSIWLPWVSRESNHPLWFSFRESPGSFPHSLAIAPAWFPPPPSPFFWGSPQPLGVVASPPPASGPPSYQWVHRSSGRQPKRWTRCEAWWRPGLSPWSRCSAEPSPRAAPRRRSAASHAACGARIVRMDGAQGENGDDLRSGKMA